MSFYRLVLCRISEQMSSSAAKRLRSTDEHTEVAQISNFNALASELHKKVREPRPVSPRCLVSLCDRTDPSLVRRRFTSDAGAVVQGVRTASTSAFVGAGGSQRHYAASLSRSTFGSQIVAIAAAEARPGGRGSRAVGDPCLFP